MMPGNKKQKHFANIPGLRAARTPKEKDRLKKTVLISCVGSGLTLADCVVRANL